MKLHREGRQTLLIMGVLSAILLSLAHVFLPLYFTIVCWVVILAFYIFLISFFRHPHRAVSDKYSAHHDVMAPADGKVVVIEEVEDNEFIPGVWKQVSIFMSPMNVHVNRHPISGVIENFAYHPGKYLVAWHPKSSTDNERTSVLYKSGENHILLRQIAGAVARRIVYYCSIGDEVKQGEELGFIKFGSRVDLLLPLDSDIQVEIGQKVRGTEDRIAVLP